MTALAISVVIPSRRGARLGLAMQALAAQTLAADRFEVLVVRDPESDPPSGDPPAGLEAHDLWAEAPCGPAAKRNLGWRAARAPLVAFTDDDCEPAPDWLERLVAAARDDPGAILQGPTMPNPRELEQLGPFSRTQRIEGPSPWFATCNVAYPVELLRELDGFDERYTGVAGEDTDLAWRARELGARDAFVPDALVHHAVEVIGPTAKLRVATRWRPAFALVARHPELRSHLYLGLFWKRSHALLLLALVGVVLARRFPPALVLALPYARALRAQMGVDRAPVWFSGYYALHDGVEMATAASGSLPHRTLVL